MEPSGVSCVQDKCTEKTWCSHAWRSQSNKYRPSGEAQRDSRTKAKQKEQPTGLGWWSAWQSDSCKINLNCWEKWRNIKSEKTWDRSMFQSWNHCSNGQDLQAYGLLVDQPPHPAVWSVTTALRPLLPRSPCCLPHCLSKPWPPGGGGKYIHVCIAETIPHLSHHAWVHSSFSHKKTSPVRRIHVLFPSKKKKKRANTCDAIIVVSPWRWHYAQSRWCKVQHLKAWILQKAKQHYSNHRCHHAY